MMLSNEILKVSHLSVRYEIHKDAFDQTWYLIAFDANDRCTIKGHEINLIRILKMAEIDFQIPSKNWSGYSIELKAMQENNTEKETEPNQESSSNLLVKIKRSFNRRP